MKDIEHFNKFDGISVTVNGNTIPLKDLIIEEISNELKSVYKLSKMLSTSDESQEKVLESLVLKSIIFYDSISKVTKKSS